MVKKEIKRVVIEKFVQVRILGPSVVPTQLAGLSTPAEVGEGEPRLHLPKVKATLPRFDPLCPHTSGSRDGVHVKVCLVWAWN